MSAAGMVGRRRVTFTALGLVPALIVCTCALAAPRQPPQPPIPLRALPSQTDASPLPNYRGDFVSLGASGVWHKPQAGQTFIGAAATGGGEPASDCSREAIIHYAIAAPGAFESDKKGLLYGVETHTPATRVWNIPGFNSCALVVHAILKRAGCSWAKYTADAKAIYDMALARGWRRTDSQEGGCIVAWNSRYDGERARIGDDGAGPRRRTLFRHVGITTGGWLAVDNTSVLSRPTRFITWRPWRYESPRFLCPPAQSGQR